MILAPISPACCKIQHPLICPPTANAVVTAEMEYRRLFIMDAYAIEARQIMEETQEAIRVSQEMIKSAQMQLVQSKVNLQTCEALLASQRESLLLHWQNADRATRES